MNWMLYVIYKTFFLLLQNGFRNKMGRSTQIEHIIGSLKCALFDSFVPSLDYYIGGTLAQQKSIKAETVHRDLFEYFIIDYLYIFRIIMWKMLSLVIRWHLLL